MAYLIMSKFILYPLFLLLLLMALSGCFRHCYRSRPFCLKQTDLDQNVRQAFKSTGVAAGDIRYEAWWHFFKDPQLNKFIEISLLCHPDIKEAEARLGRAYQEALIVRSALLPHIFAVADIKREKVSTTAPGFVPGAPDQFTDITLELTPARYELDIWRKNRSLYCAALDRSRSEAANFEEAKLLLSTTVAAVYFDLQYTLARKDVTQKRLKARKELYDLHKQRFGLGITSEFRLYQVDTDVQLLEDLVLQLDARIEIDVHALAALVGNVACVCGEKGVHLVEPRARSD